MRVVMPLRALRRDQVALLDQLGDRKHRLAGRRDAHEGVGHFPFQQQPVVEGDVGVQHRRDVGASGLVEMRVHALRSEEPTSELQSLMRTSYAVFCLKKKKNNSHTPPITTTHKITL